MFNPRLERVVVAAGSNLFGRGHHRLFGTGDLVKKTFGAPPAYRRLTSTDLYWVASEAAANRTFLRSHPDVHHEYFVEDGDDQQQDLKKFFIKSFFGDTCEGPPLHSHGGLTAAILDEAMGTSCWANKISVMTREFTIKYNKPVLLNREIHGEAFIERIDGRQVKTCGSLYYPESPGTPLVEATGVFLVLDESTKQKMRGWSKVKM